MLAQNKKKKVKRLKTKFINYSFLLFIFLQLKAFRISNQLLQKISHRKLANMISAELRGKFSDEEIFQVAILFDECKRACILDGNCICMLQIQYLDDWFRVVYPRHMKDLKYRKKIDELIKETHRIFK